MHRKIMTTLALMLQYILDKLTLLEYKDNEFVTAIYTNNIK